MCTIIPTPSQVPLVIPLLKLQTRVKIPTLFTLNALNKDSPAAKGARKPDQFRAAGLRLQPGPSHSMALPGQLKVPSGSMGRGRSRAPEQRKSSFKITGETVAVQEGGSWEHPPGKSPPFYPKNSRGKILTLLPLPQHTNIYRDRTSRKQSLTPSLRAGAAAPAGESNSLKIHQECGLKGWESSSSVKLLLDGGAA